MSTSVANLSMSDNHLSSSFSALVNELLDINLRENALAELSKQREQLPDLAVILWNRFGNNIFSYF